MLNATTSSSYFVYFVAVFNDPENESELQRILMNGGATINATDEHTGDSALIVAAERGRIICNICVVSYESMRIKMELY